MTPEALEPDAPSPREFARFQRLIHDEAGIDLSEAKKELLAARLRKRVRELGLRSFGAYYERVLADDGERTHMLDRISTNETRFFREPRQLDFLVEDVLPRWRREARERRRPPRLRAWSAGCASGEEPYTLAMIALEQLPREEGWTTEILATDLSSRALERAREGCYRLDCAQDIPQRHLRTHMLRGVGSREGTMTVGRAARSLVRFAHLNLVSSAPYPWGPFDLVLCRNVLIYFDGTTRDRVVGRLVERLAPQGLLLLGHAETLSGSRHPLRSAGPLTFARAGEARP